MIMASVVDWSKLGGRASAPKTGGGKGGQGGPGKPEWLRIGDKVKVRPVGQAVEFVKIFVKTKNGNRSVVVDPEDAEKAVALLSAEANYDVRANNRFAMNMIDREDGRIKVLEGGMQIFGYWAQWQNTTGIHPGSREGYDWVIKAEKTGPDPENKKYTPMSIQPTAITAAEWELINKKKTEYSLAEVYKSVPLDKVVEYVFGDRKSDSAPKQAASAPPAETEGDEFGPDDTATAAPAAPAGASKGPIDW
jgi:hypothetical protein